MNLNNLKKYRIIDEKGRTIQRFRLMATAKEFLKRWERDFKLKKYKIIETHNDKLQFN